MRRPKHGCFWEQRPSAPRPEWCQAIAPVLLFPDLKGIAGWECCESAAEFLRVQLRQGSFCSALPLLLFSLVFSLAAACIPRVFPLWMGRNAGGHRSQQRASPGRWGAQGDTDQRGIDQRLRASQLINVAEADIQNLLTA